MKKGKAKYWTAVEQYLKDGVHLNLKKVRNRIGKSQKEMAKWFDVSQPYYSNLEDGKRILNALMLKKLSEGGISADFILTGQGNLYNSYTPLNYDI
jgi:transcriptional regulator with XRE-family HTH domain